MYILSLDQGTTSSRALVYDPDARIVAISQKEVPLIYPNPGWVEQDPMVIWGSQSGVARAAIETAGISPDRIRAIGIANQRETTIVWDRTTGRPVYNAIVWQCRRTAPICRDLTDRGLEREIREKTGLVIDSYFSATKLRWILDHVEGAQEKAEKGDLLFGTVDTWLIWNLTRGAVHATDASNASRTMMFNIRTMDWDDRILELLRIPRRMLPKVLPSSHVFGSADPQIFGTSGIPIAGVAGDQQAALFGQACFEEGSVKNTYGTGCFLLMNTGSRPVYSQSGLLTTVAWRIGEETTYALEGSIFNAGSAVQWLRDEMRMISTAAESEEWAVKVPDTNGVFFVPAFSGLGAPYWDMYARGMLIGLTRDTNKNHIIRATLESLAFQTRDVIDAMEKDAGMKLEVLRVDGGASRNNFVLSFQADILGSRVERPEITESTSLGAAFLAGLEVGFWKDRAELSEKLRIDRVFEPSISKEQADRCYRRWQNAVDRTRNWEELCPE